jgi:hypothetical protein
MSIVPRTSHTIPRIQGALEQRTFAQPSRTRAAQFLKERSTSVGTGMAPFRVGVRDLSDGMHTQHKRGGGPMSTRLLFAETHGRTLVVGSKA